MNVVLGLVGGMALVLLVDLVLYRIVRRRRTRHARWCANCRQQADGEVRSRDWRLKR